MRYLIEELRQNKNM